MLSVIKNAFVKRRGVLIVDDEEINREILASMIGEEYVPYYASNGQEAIAMLEAHSEALCLIMLDINMPVMNGMEFLEWKKKAPSSLRNIPVIVLTSERSLEIESLRNGAIDFIKKPYESSEIIAARVARIVELYETSETILHTSRDAKTGLFTKEYFVFYVSSKGEELKDMDILALQIVNYVIAEEMIGRAKMEEIMSKIGDFLRHQREIYHGLGTLYHENTFLFIGDHRDNYDAFIAELQELLRSTPNGDRIRFKIGVYYRLDTHLEPSILINRAIHSIEPIRNDSINLIHAYDNALHDKIVYQEKLVQGFDHSLESGQFIAFYQPKYRIDGDKPVLAGAEALVRWRHPEYGMISPGEFIPLFEHNALISRLDRAIYAQAAMMIAEVKKTAGIDVPISVNVSRLEIFDPSFTPYLLDIVKKNNIDPSLLHLEITETAFTESTKELVAIVTNLRELGFSIEVDDFGSGYSSLNMIADLPFDILKIDMGFVRNMLRGEKNLNLVHTVIDIAKMMQVQVIAEGVENKEQYDYLKSFGCNYIQGYYFSKPLPKDDFLALALKENQQ